MRLLEEALHDISPPAFAPLPASRVHECASSTTQRMRKVELVRAAWGAVLLCAPRQTLETIHHVKVDNRSVLVARFLGARHLAQAAVSGVSPSSEVLAMGVWVDVVHALTALGLAVADRSRARAGLTDTSIAAIWAGTGYHDLARVSPAAATRQRRRDRLARMVLGIVPGGHLLIQRAASSVRDRAQRPHQPRCADGLAR